MFELKITSIEEFIRFLEVFKYSCIKNAKLKELSEKLNKATSKLNQSIEENTHVKSGS